MCWFSALAINPHARRSTLWFSISSGFVCARCVSELSSPPWSWIFPYLNAPNFGVVSTFSRGLLVPIVFRFLSSQGLQSLGGGWQVSSYGRCCSSRGVISPGCHHANGYRFCSDWKNSNWLVHRLVMLAFCGPPPDEQTWQVHHKDGDKMNNRLDNLKYVSPTQNVLHSYATGKRRSSGLAQSKPVAWRQLGADTWNTCASVGQAAEQLEISQSTVSRACRGQVPAKGYEFRFEELRDRILPGEEWRPMVCPIAKTVVTGRTISSVGRVTSKRGVISKGYLEQSGYYYTRIWTTFSSVKSPPSIVW